MPELSLPFAEQDVLAWVLTFAVHSTVLLGSVALVRWLSRGQLRESIEEALWRFALVASLISASLQLALVDEPGTGHLGVFVADPAPVELADPTPETATRPAPLESIAQPSTRATAPTQWSLDSEEILCWALLATAGFGLLRFALAALAGRRLLAGRQRIRDGRGPALLGSLCARAGHYRMVRLSVADRLGSPVAFGVVRPEIALPARAFEALTEPQLRSMLAHELSHLIARDPAWLRLHNLLLALFPWQPLLWMARRRSAELAEYRADSFAAEGGANLPTAQCLVEVAGWVAAGDLSPAPHALSGMALAQSALGRRVDRLLQGETRLRVGRHRYWLAPGLLALLGASTTALPGFGSTGPESPQENSGAERAAEEPGPRGAAPLVLSALLELMDEEFLTLRAEVGLLGQELLNKDDSEETRALLDELEARLDLVQERRRRIRMEFERLAELWSAGSEQTPLESNHDDLEDR